jgi:hypothetical protein
LSKNEIEKCFSEKLIPKIDFQMQEIKTEAMIMRMKKRQKYIKNKK